VRRRSGGLMSKKPTQVIVAVLPLKSVQPVDDGPRARGS
jgi:hypothetical protein